MSFWPFGLIILYEIFGCMVFIYSVIWFRSIDPVSIIRCQRNNYFFWVLKNLLPQENADPTLSISEADSDQDDTVIDDDECRDVMDHDSGSCRDVSVNSDGFDISDEFQLDEPDLDCTKKSAHNNSDTEDEPRYI